MVSDNLDEPGELVVGTELDAPHVGEWQAGGGELFLHFLDDDVLVDSCDDAGECRLPRCASEGRRVRFGGNHYFKTDDASERAEFAGGVGVARFDEDCAVSGRGNV